MMPALESLSSEISKLMTRFCLPNRSTGSAAQEGYPAPKQRQPYFWPLISICETTVLRSQRFCARRWHTALSMGEKPDATLQTAESPDVNAHSSQHPTPPEAQLPRAPDLASYSLPTSFGKQTNSYHTPPLRTTLELTYAIEWLAICRAYHSFRPFLCLQHTGI